MSVKNLYPNIEPTLNLSFALTKALDPRVSFARASTARAYDGKTVAKAEENLFQRSQEFDNAYWTTLRLTIVANSTTAPDGTSTAETATPTTELGAHRFRSPAITLAANSATYSIFVKANGYTKVALREGQTSGASAAFDLTGSGSLVADNSAGGVTVSNSTITELPNSWFRISTTFTGLVTQIFELYVLDPSYTSGAVTGSWTPDGTSGVFLWGAQLEQRSAVTAYTPTTTQPITNYVPVLQSAANNVARFDHNPVTGESLGLLIEEQRTNLVLRSTEVGGTGWTAISSGIAATINSIIAPDGTLTGSTIRSSVSQSFQAVAQAISTFGESSVSWYVKRANWDWIVFGTRRSDGTSNNIAFNLATGEFGSKGASVSNEKVVNVGNGWWRVSYTTTTNGTFNTPCIHFGISSSHTAYLGTSTNLTEEFYVWGAQVELGAFPTSYVKTEASQVTRSADAASMTGANFSSWYRQDEGSVYIEYDYLAATNSVLDFVESGTSNRWYLNTDASKARVIMRPNGSVQASLTDSGVSNPINTMTKASFAYKVNDFASSQAGRAVITDTDGYVTNNINTLSFNGAPIFSVFMGHIRKLAYYPKRLADAEIVALTAS